MKYSISNSMYHKWKESYNTFGLDVIKSHPVRIDDNIKELKSENKKLNKMLADKELENALLGESLKK